MSWTTGSTTAVVAALLAAVATVGCSDGDADELARRQAADRDAAVDANGEAPGELSLVAPRDGIGEATLVVVGGTDSVAVTSGDLDDDLYRISAPDGAGIAPRAVTTEAPADDGADAGIDADDTGQADDPDSVVPVVEVHVEDTGTGGPAALEVELSAAVRWTVRLSGGSTEARVDAAAGGLDALEVTAGVTRLETWLPAAETPVTVRESGGASQVVVHAPSEAPVRVDVRGGAGSLDVDGEVSSGVPAGTVVAPPGWDAAAGRVDVVLVGGVSSVVVDRSD